MQDKTGFGRLFQKLDSIEFGTNISMYQKLRSSGRQLELEVVATIFIIATSSFLFLKLVGEVREGETRAVDEAILLALRNPANPPNPVGPSWLEVMFRDLTSLGSPSVLALVVVAAVGYLWLERERGTALFVNGRGVARRYYRHRCQSAANQGKLR
jgi:hypothetical protein